MAFSIRKRRPSVPGSFNKKGAQTMSAHKALSGLGGWVRGQIGGIGYFTQFLGAADSQRHRRTPPRPGVAAGSLHRQLFALIIAVSGPVRGLRAGPGGATTPQPLRFPKRRWACCVALSLVRELGPVVTALLFAGYAGTSLTAEIGLNEGRRVISAMEVMAVDPMRACCWCRASGRHHRHPGAGGGVFMVGILGGWIVGVLMIGVDAGAFWSADAKWRGCAGRRAQRR